MTEDDQFGRRLGTLLRDELSDVHSAPGMTARLRGRAKRNLLHRSGAVVSVAIVAAVGLVVTLDSDGTSGVTTPPGMVDVAYVRTQVTEALDRSADSILLAHSTYGVNGRDDQWTDPVTGRRRIDLYVNGSLSTSAVETPDASGGARWFQINYQSRDWTDDYSTADERRVPRSENHFQDVPTGDPADIRDAVANGTLEVVGMQTMDGHDTVRLRLTLTTDPNKLPVAMEMWVDAVTYLPYCEKISKSGKFDEATQSIVYTWLERTPENLKLFTLTAPAGFTDHTGGGVAPPR